MAVHTAGTPPTSPSLTPISVTHLEADTSRQATPVVQTENSARHQSSPAENARAGRAGRSQFLARLFVFRPFESLKNVLRFAPAGDSARSQPAPERSGRGEGGAERRQLLARFSGTFRTFDGLRNVFRSAPEPVVTTPAPVDVKPNGSSIDNGFPPIPSGSLAAEIFADPGFSPYKDHFETSTPVTSQSAPPVSGSRAPQVEQNRLDEEGKEKGERIVVNLGRGRLAQFRAEKKALDNMRQDLQLQDLNLPSHVSAEVEKMVANFFTLQRHLLPGPFGHLRLRDPSTYSSALFVRLASEPISNAIQYTIEKSADIRSLRGSDAKTAALNALNSGELSTILPTDGLMEFYFARNIGGWENVPKSAILIHGDVLKIGPGNHVVTMYFQNLPINGGRLSLFNRGAGIAGHAGASVSVCVNNGHKPKHVHATAGTIRALVVSDPQPTDALVVLCKDKNVQASFIKYMQLWAVPEHARKAVNHVLMAYDTRYSDKQFDDYFSTQMAAALVVLELEDTPENREVAREHIRHENLQKAIPIAREWYESLLESEPTSEAASESDLMMSDPMMSESMMSDPMMSRSTPRSRPTLSRSTSGAPEMPLKLMPEVDKLSEEDREAFKALLNFIIPYAVSKMSRMYAAEARPFEKALALLQKAYEQGQREPNETNWHIDKDDGKEKSGTVCTSIVMLCLQMGYIDKGIKNGTIKVGIDEDGELDFDKANLQEIIEAIPEELRVHPDNLSPRLFHHCLLTCDDFDTIGALRSTPVLKEER